MYVVISSSYSEYSVVHKENIEIKSCVCQVAAYKKIKSSVKLTPYETWLFSRVCNRSDWKNVGILNCKVQERSDSYKRIFYYPVFR